MTEINCDKCVGFRGMQCDTFGRADSFVTELLTRTTTDIAESFQRIGDPTFDQRADELIDETAEKIADNLEHRIDTLGRLGCTLTREEMIQKLTI